MRVTHRKAVGVLLATMTVAATWATTAPGATADPAATPSVRNRGVQATCGVGSLRFEATLEQRLPAGSSVRLVDTVDEDGTTRRLTDSTIVVPLDVAASIGVDHPMRFRSQTARADFTYTRTIEVRLPGAAPADPPIAVDSVTVRCAGAGPGIVTETVDPVPPPATADPVLTPRFTG